MIARFKGIYLPNNDLCRTLLHIVTCVCTMIFCDISRAVHLSTSASDLINSQVLAEFKVDNFYLMRISCA